MEGDDLLDQLKRTAADREHAAEARRSRRTARLLLGGGLAFAGVVVGVAAHQLLSHTPTLHLPDRVGDFPRMHSAAASALMSDGLDALRRDNGASQVAGAFYSNDPNQPQLVVVLMLAKHTEQDVADLRGSLEAPVFGGTPSTPDGPHIRSATVNGVDFVCEPVIENGDNGPVGERTNCTWDDHGDGIGLLIDLDSGESDVALREAEAIQPGTIN